MTKAIQLSRGKVALVDDADFEWLNIWKWTYQDAGKYIGYASRNVYQDGKYIEHIYMHRIILNPPSGMETDHINGNGLDNRRCNLRICTTSQNLANSRKRKGTTSQYKGVSWSQKNQCWIAAITVHGQHEYLGCFDSEEEAAIAYNYAARKLYDDYALLNSVPNRPPIPSRLKKRPGKTSRYVGVSWSQREGYWRAEIRVNYELIWLGSFDSEKEAAQAWNAAALKYRGAKAKLNRIPVVELDNDQQ